MPATLVVTLSHGGSAFPLAPKLSRTALRLVVGSSLHQTYPLMKRLVRPQVSRCSFHHGVKSAFPQDAQTFLSRLRALKEHEQARAAEGQRSSQSEVFKRNDFEGPSFKSGVSGVFIYGVGAEDLRHISPTISALEICNAFRAKETKKEIQKILPGCISSEIAALIVRDLKEHIYLEESRAKIEDLRASEKKDQDVLGKENRKHKDEDRDASTDMLAIGGILALLWVVLYVAISLIDDPVVIERTSTRQERLYAEKDSRQKQEEDERKVRRLVEERMNQIRDTHKFK